MKNTIFLLLAIFVSDILFAQDDFLNAQTLFDKQKYSAAQAVLNKLSSSGDVTAEIMYLNAKCSKELFLEDAKMLYKKHLDDYPYSQHKNQIYEDVALIYFREKNLQRHCGR